MLDDRERRYRTTKKEMLAMVYAAKHFRHYFYGRTLTIITHHNALKGFKDSRSFKSQWPGG